MVNRVVRRHERSSAPHGGYSQLFQRLIGYTPRYPFVGNADVLGARVEALLHRGRRHRLALGQRHAARPTPTDARHDRAVRPAGAAQATTLTLALAARRLLHDAGVPRALEHQRQQPAPRDREPDAAGRARASRSPARTSITPVSSGGLDPNHAVDQHRVVLRLPQEARSAAPVLGNAVRLQRPQRLPGAARSAARPNPRPAVTGGALAFANVNARRRQLRRARPAADAGDGSDATDAGRSALRLSVAQKLCFFANSSACCRDRPRVPARRRRLRERQVQLREPGQRPVLVAAGDRRRRHADLRRLGGQRDGGVARRSHLCASLSNRLYGPDICALLATIPTTAQAAT